MSWLAHAAVIACTLRVRPFRGRFEECCAMQIRPIAREEYARRRGRVLRALRGAAAVVFAGEGEHPIVGSWRPDLHFSYLTGIEDEPGAAVFFDPKADNPKRRCVLLLRPLDSESARWDGYREEICAGLRERTGFETVMRTPVLGRLLTQAARRCGRLACLHPLASHTAPVSPDLQVFRKVAERIPGVVIEDRSDLLAGMRAVKSPSELALMRAAVRATAAGFDAALRFIRPGVSEWQIRHLLERTYIDYGAEGVAYNTIVGSGVNATVLHYNKNTGMVGGDDVIVIDSGAQVRGYAADITRAFPASGRFTADQREVYETVLRAQEAAIRAAKPGATIWDVDGAARDVIERAGYGDAYIHGIGHHLGLHVHDVMPDGALAPGMVITVEPGIYLPERPIGVRIEDDVLITRRGNENLTRAVPKSVKEIEAVMSSARR